jgi:replicative DNA helicase
MEDQIARDLSSSLGVGLKEIYSSETPISQDLYNKIENEVENIALLPIFYVDKVGTARDITQTILNFAEVRNLQSENKGLVVTIDHTLLTKNNKGEAEKQRVDELYLSLVELKKHFSHENIKIMFVLLSQLNRDIQSNERVSNPKLHYPTQNDLFASSSAYQCSDYVVILHRPVVVSGMGAYYGPPRDGFPHGLPVIHPTLNKSMIYLHVIKERFGTPVVIACIEQFNKNQISERNPNE